VALDIGDSLRIHKSGRDILSVEDWFKYAPPKKGGLQWKDNRSAKGLAQSWLRGGTPKPPEELVALLEVKFGTGITFDEARPECVIELDDFAGEHRNCDLVILCNVGAKRMVISAEAKADEPFGDLIGEYYDRKTGSGSNVPARIRQLSIALFGREADEPIRNLRYQLLHAAAATLIEARAKEAETGVLLVHEFRSASLNKDKVTQNATDWQHFVHAFPEVATARIEENQILGPLSVPGGGRVPNSVPLYLAHLVTELK
jgi:hypothetical protein